ncbi:hypothetical protein [Mycobacterium sp. 236(2023)]|uniref:hypothetical protein n=1 Tax=Mycobacterium sp. 236(2023) TaxID=3038163 RepID=UPI00241590DF|nr:hypothetical protein [Mycobacterium sp. 236(2023)]MDG4664591.1 hypothetical protein [Mycobacterium sp. 236(2023)]
MNGRIVTLPDFRSPTRDFAPLATSPNYWDPTIECSMVYATPSTEPDLWNDYVQGAYTSYRKHNIDVALDVDALRSGHDTALFAACVNRSGKVIGGLRARGPYGSADECHAVKEWDGQPGQDAVYKMVADRIPFGVAEMKTAWVTDDPEEGRRVTTAIARTPLHAMTLLDIQFVVATAASYVLKRWVTSGGVLASKIPATPYPDKRYGTRLAWWDRANFANHAEPRQVSAFFAEQRQMAATMEPRRTPVVSDVATR